MLFGDAELIAEIRSNLSGERQVVLHSGVSRWMVEHDPYAVQLISPVNRRLHILKERP